ncbi:PcfJ domain-containing protein [Thomasclavelia cocleata]|uniref:PcfJ domain-containing protein n=1 Tax=Thomasclavelia cocleata TaxID=69824 RepID=UPI00256EC528|nr:PcfJ domain-containing protein [Thomasclavelia cocleata]
MFSISEKLKEDFIKNSTKVSLLVKGETISKKCSTYFNYKEFYPKEFVCSCSEGKDKIQIIPEKNRETVCKFCGNKYGYSWDIFTKEALDEYNKNTYGSNKKPLAAVKTDEVVYIRKHLVEENSIEIFIGNVKVIPTINNLGGYTLETNLNITNYAEIIPGKGANAYKILKKSNKLIDLFEMFNINSKNINSRNCVYENADDIFDFIEQNQVFASRIGFIEALKGLTKNYDQDAFFILHLALITEYPVLELLIKMKYLKLYFDIVDKMILAGSRYSILDSVKELNKLLNNTTKGTLALKIPQYIGTYLKEKSASLNEYIAWCDIYDLENISKENFENLINTSYYLKCLMSGQLKNLPNIMKYDYKLEKLLKYLHKASKQDTDERYYSSKYYKYQNAIDLLKDYLEMCDLMDIKPDKTPMNLKKAHDDMADAYKAKENEIYDSKFDALSKAVTKCITRDVDESEYTKMESKYAVIVPKNSRDFVDEGQQQHNCVGSYCRSVLNGYCIIFFIRKRESLNESYITAEYRNGSIGQIMYKNNIRVDDNDIIDYCKVICNKIKRGLINGDIPDYSKNSI